MDRNVFTFSIPRRDCMVVATALHHLGMEAAEGDDIGHRALLLERYLCAMCKADNATHEIESLRMLLFADKKGAEHEYKR